MLRIVSMVVKCTINQPLDIPFLINEMDGASAPKKGHAWVRIRLMPGNYDAVFFKSGKFVITGIKEKTKIDNIVNQVLDKLNEIVKGIKIINIEIVNFVFSGQISLNSTLEKIMINLNDNNASYEPEVFPGLIYKKWGATFLLFSNGKLVITGIKKEGYAGEVLIRFQKLVSKI